MKKILFLISSALFTLSAMAQTAMVVCQSTSSSYKIDPARTNSTYYWDLEDPNSTGGATFVSPTYDATNPALVVGTEVKIQWDNSGTFNLKSQEKNEWGCLSPWTTQEIVVSEKPEVDDMNTSLCSYSTENPQMLDLALATTGTNNATVGKWKLVDIQYFDSDPANSYDITTTTITTVSRTGDINIGDTFTDKDALLGDKFVNNAPDNAYRPAYAVYTITPYAGECAGDNFTITAKIFPAVSAPTIVEVTNP